MGFGFKKNQKQRMIGIKKDIHRVTGFGTKALAVSEFLFPEFLPEKEGARQVVKRVNKLTK